MTNTIEQNIKMIRWRLSVDNYAACQQLGTALNGAWRHHPPAAYITFRPWLGGNANGIALLMNTNTFAKGIDGHTRLT